MADPERGDGPAPIDDHDHSGPGAGGADLSPGTVRAERLLYDYSRRYPASPRGPEQSAVPAFRPHPAASNPAIDRSDVTDVDRVETVADPFLAYEDGTYHLFFEVRHDDDGDGEFDQDIAHAASPDGLEWTYDRIVLSTASGSIVSYPNVFKWEGEWYMAPSRGDADLHYYRADEFPTEWSVARARPAGGAITLHDPTTFRYRDFWYIIGQTYDDEVAQLWHADDFLEGEWREHPANPILTDADTTRPGGRPLVHEDHVDFFFQDGSRGYGWHTRLRRITTLSPEAFEMAEVATSPVTGATFNGAWNHDGMHHVDALLPTVGGSNVVAVDGKDAATDTSTGAGHWSIGIYTMAAGRPVFTVATLPEAQPVSSGSYRTARVAEPIVDEGHDLDAANDRIVAPTSGYYDLRAILQYGSGDPSGAFEARLVGADGEPIAPPTVAAGSGGDVTTVEVARQAYLSEGDSLSVQARQATGGPVELLPGSRLSLRRLE